MKMELTEEQKLLLEMVIEELKGKISYYTCVDRNTQHSKIVIEYGNTPKN